VRRVALLALGLLLALAAGLALGPDDGTGVRPGDSGEAAAASAGVDRAPVVPRLARTADRLIDVRTTVGVVLASAVAAALTAAGRRPTTTACPASRSGGTTAPGAAHPPADDGLRRVELLLRNLGSVVPTTDVLAAYAGAGGSVSAASHRSLVHRLGRRVAEVGLRLHTVRGRGLLLEA